MCVNFFGGKMWFEPSEEILCSYDVLILVVLYKCSISQSLTNVSAKQCFTVNEVKSSILILVLLNSQGMKCDENCLIPDTVLSNFMCSYIMYL